MRVTFDPDFDDVAWPGPLGRMQASVGEAWVGFERLLDLLELGLGLRAPRTPQHVRVGRVLSRILGMDGFWTRSAAVDPLGTARRLIHWHDSLCLRGWNPPLRDGGPRLTALAELLAEDRLGPADRLAAVEAALARGRDPEIESIALLDRETALPLAWRRVLGALRERGTSVVERPLAPAPARGDLAAARAAPFRPVGDESLVLLRPPAPIAAADEIAGWLSSVDGLDGTVVIGPDALLDRTLVRHGLPSTGAPARASDLALLRVLPLVLAMASVPPDPAAALELLAIPLGPVPMTLCRRLQIALCDRPAVDSDRWRAALDAGLDSIADAELRRRERTRLTTLFSPAERDGRVPVAAIRERVDLLQGWAEDVLARAPRDRSRALFTPVVAQLAAFRRLIEAWPTPSLSEAAIARLVALATEAAPVPPVHAPLAGLSGVARPSLVAGPARRIVWWNFTRASEPPPFPELPLEQAEREALLRAGVELPDRAELAERAARRRRRPLLQATETLVFVCPRRDSTGEGADPHPLWDEIIAALDDPGHARALLRAVSPTRAPAPRRERALRDPPRPRRRWSTGAVVLKRPPAESSASIGSLLSCSFRWALERGVGLRPGLTAGLAPLIVQIGTLAHDVILRLVRSPLPLPPESIEDAAGRLFDEVGPRVSARLFRRGSEALRAEARRAIALAAATLSHDIEAAGMRVEAVEVERSGDALGGRLEGRLDLVLGPASTVVDLKLGSGEDRRRELARGTAYQLAIYARLLRTDEPVACATAYFIVRERRLISTDAAAFPAAEVVPGPSADATFAALERAYETRRAEVDRGLLLAPGNPDDEGRVHPERDGVEGGVLVLAPLCGYCRLGALCGRAFGGAA